MNRRRTNALKGRIIGLALLSVCAPAVVAQETKPAAGPEVAVPAPATAAPSDNQIDKWIAELSHDVFAVRQSAASQLLATGASARERLQAAADSPDPETRAAARRLVALIQQSEFQRRLEAFAADTDGRRGLTLPGWERFRELVGGDPMARTLFVEMQRQEAGLLLAVFGGAGQPAESVWEDRLVRILSWNAVNVRNGGPPLGSCAAMLFLGSIDEMDVSDRGALNMENLIQRPPVRDALQPGGPHAAIRRLVAAWILHCPNTNEMLLARRLDLASTMDLKEALPLALAVAGGDPKYIRVSPFARARAALLIGQFGGAQHVERLEPLLNDATVCLQGQVRVPGGAVPTIEVRDVALVALLQLTGQNPAEYGYPKARLMQPQRTFQIPMLQPENSEQRPKAIAKWRAWRAGQAAQR